MGICEKSMRGESASEKSGQNRACWPAFDCFGRRRRWAGKIGPGILLIVIGLLWLARAAGMFQVAYFWPMILIIFGIWVYAMGIICGVPMILGGSLWLGETLGLFPAAYFWPLFVIIIGIFIVAIRLVRARV